MLTYDEALQRILTGTAPLPVAREALIDCLGRTLAETIAAPIDLPPFDNSAMDGYAVRAEDLRRACDDYPVDLRLIGEIPAGGDAAMEVGPDQAARIFTGGMLPPGADSIVPIEDTATSTKEREVRVILAPEPGAYIRRSGSDIRRGDRALGAGMSIRPYEISLAAGLGFADLTVHRAPRVAIIGSGNELVEPGSGPLEPGRIYNSNVYALAAQVIAAGCVVAARLHATDDRDSLRICLDSAISAGADAIVTSGGVSVGDYDLVKSAVEQGGGKIDFWRVAIRPGKPFVFGRYRDALFFGLPGNPVSTMVTFELFVRPALRRLSGCPTESCARELLDAVLLEDAGHDPGRRSFQRARAEQIESRLTVKPLSGQGSHMIGAIARANALLVVPEEMESMPAGSLAKVMLLD